MNIKILEKAIDLFLQFGIKSISMDDIAKELGISKKTLYQQVKDKKTLVLDALKMYLDRSIDELKSVNAEKDLTALEKLVRIQQRDNTILQDVKPNLMIDLQKYYPESWEYVQVHVIGTLRMMMVKNLEEGIAEGYYRSEMNLDIISRLLISNIYTFSQEDILPANKFTKSEIHEQLYIAHMYGIVNFKGHQALTNILNKIKNK